MLWCLAYCSLTIKLCGNPCIIIKSSVMCKSSGPSLPNLSKQKRKRQIPKIVAHPTFSIPKRGPAGSPSHGGSAVQGWRAPRGWRWSSRCTPAYSAARGRWWPPWLWSGASAAGCDGGCNGTPFEHLVVRWFYMGKYDIDMDLSGKIGCLNAYLNI